MAAVEPKERMVHIRLDPELHRALRLIVAEQDTTIQNWISQTIRDAIASVERARTDTGGAGQ